MGPFLNFFHFNLNLVWRFHNNRAVYFLSQNRQNELRMKLSVLFLRITEVQLIFNFLLSSKSLERNVIVLSQRSSSRLAAFIVASLVLFCLSLSSNTQDRCKVIVRVTEVLSWAVLFVPEAIIRLKWRKWRIVNQMAWNPVLHTSVTTQSDNAVSSESQNVLYSSIKPVSKMSYPLAPNAETYRY